MTPDDLAFLRSGRGEGLLTALAAVDLSDGAILPLITRLRADYSPSETRAAIALMQARRSPGAIAKFGADAGRLFLTAEAVEQASVPAARAWRTAEATRIAPAHLLDVCCGLGADALALAEVAPVTAIEIDPGRAAIAQHNADLLARPVTVVQADARALPDTLIHSADLIFFDPARRADGSRLHHVESLIPPLSTALGWGDRPTWVKLSPGVQLDQLAAYPDAGLDFISADGELKEALLRLHDPFAVARRAVMHLAGVTHTIITDPDARAPIGELRGWLCEPDPAIIRAGAVGQTAIAAGGWQIDDQIAYFMTDAPPDVPYVRAWRVLDWMPFSLKDLKKWLRARGYVRVTVKKRGSPVTPEAVQAALRLPGGDGPGCTIALTRWHDRPVIIICEEMPTQTGVKGS